MTLPAIRPEDDDERPAPGTDALPPLPFEYHVVATARALAAAKTKCDLALMLLQFTARDQAQVWNALQQLHEAATAASTAYAGYSELLNCKGRA